MEVVTLAKLWGRVGDNPHLSPPARGAGGLRALGLSLYICTTWGETPARERRAGAPNPSAPAWCTAMAVGKLGPCWPPA